LLEVPRHMKDLQRAIVDGNASDTQEISHTLKGELGYLGIPEVSRRAAELEDLGRKADLPSAQKLYEVFEVELSGVLSSVRDAVEKVGTIDLVAGQRLESE
jgi:HPt (histidine-containing phosphotransfer) domain-containing protein